MSERKVGRREVMQRLTTSCKQIDVQLVSRQWLPWKRTLTPPSSASPVLLLSMTLYHMGYPFGEFGSTVPAVSPPSLLPTQSLPYTVATEWKTEKALMLCKYCSPITKTLLCYQHRFSHKSKHSTTGAAMKTVNSIPARPSTFTKTFEQCLTCINSTVGCIQVGQNPAEPPVQVKWPRNSDHSLLHFFTFTSLFTLLHFFIPLVSKGGSGLSFYICIFL